MKKRFSFSGNTLIKKHFNEAGKYSVSSFPGTPETKGKKSDLDHVSECSSKHTTDHVSEHTMDEKCQRNPVSITRKKLLLSVHIRLKVFFPLLLLIFLILIFFFNEILYLNFYNCIGSILDDRVEGIIMPSVVTLCVCQFV